MVNVLPERHYRKPPLIEVLADFHFEPIQDREWDPKNLSQFATAIKELGYPTEENLRSISRRFRHGVPIRIPRNTNWPWRHRFASADGNQTTQVGENLLVINQFPPYYGWKQFQQQTLDCFRIYHQAWPAGRIAQLGLHYVDVVEIPGESFFIDDYFNMYPVIPEGQGGAWRNLTMSCEAQIGREGDVCSLAFHQRPSANPEVNTFRFRWDYRSRNGIAAEIVEVSSWIDRAHTFLSAAFRSTFTEKCEQLFEPEN